MRVVIRIQKYEYHCYTLVCGATVLPSDNSSATPIRPENDKYFNITAQTAYSVKSCFLSLIHYDILEELSLKI